MINTVTSPKVSVIVPVYKAESYLHKCVDSLLAQTFRDFEILLVDDGSPDRSGAICDEYAKKDSRVRVFHKENGGVSSARQCGLDHARGEYTIHADPDDWVEPAMLEELYRKAKEEDADMVICDYYVDLKDRTIYRKQQPTALDRTTVMRELFQQLHGSCCNKLVRRACYKDNSVEFPNELNCFEDLVFNVRLLVHCRILVYQPSAYYHYVQNVNDNSLVNSSTLKQNETLLELMRRELPDSIFEKVYSLLLFDLLFRAFELKCFSSKEFRSRYGCYGIYLKNISYRSKIKLILLRLSCHGFYTPAYLSYRLIRWMHRC